MDMSTNRFKQIVFVSIFIFLTSCSPPSTTTPYRPLTRAPQIQQMVTATLQAVVNSPASPGLVVTSTLLPCTNDLTYAQDLTIPDGTLVKPGEQVDKQWLVTNTGTCDWEGNYRLKWVGGEPLSATLEQALFPARAGSQATLRILFTAPGSTGTYQSTWQAFAPDGTAFGDFVYLQIFVTQ